MKKPILAVCAFSVLFVLTTVPPPRVRITTPDVAPGPDDHAKHAFVVMDDCLFAEPQAVRSSVHATRDGSSFTPHQPIARGTAHTSRLSCIGGTDE